jgi:ribosomal protein S18 acetylase RimI-like enzyme
VFVDKVSELTDEIYESVCRLVPQLGAHKVVPTRDELIALIDSEASMLLTARFPDKDSDVVGILTISIYRVPTGIRSIVEDVIVDSSMRRRGVAKALMLAAIEIARDAGANGVALTSNAQRVEANLLYQNMGFSKRETNAYFYKLK